MKSAFALPDQSSGQRALADPGRSHHDQVAAFAFVDEPVDLADQLGPALETADIQLVGELGRIENRLVYPLECSGNDLDGHWAVDVHVSARGAGTNDPLPRGHADEDEGPAPLRRLVASPWSIRISDTAPRMEPASVYLALPRQFITSSHPPCDRVRTGRSVYTGLSARLFRLTE